MRGDGGENKRIQTFSMKRKSDSNGAGRGGLWPHWRGWRIDGVYCFLEWNHNWRNGIELGGLTEWQYLLYQWSVPIKGLLFSLY